jgi:hypothetical protein
MRVIFESPRRTHCPGVDNMSALAGKPEVAELS